MRCRATKLSEDYVQVTNNKDEPPAGITSSKLQVIPIYLTAKCVSWE